MTAVPAGCEAAPTVAAALDGAARRLAASGIAEARREARVLLAHVLGGPEVAIGHPERPLSGSETETLAALVEARAARRPMAQVLGRREFWSLRFEVTEATLDPRPDSECLVEAALDSIADRSLPLRLLDLGTGTGCLLLALLHELPNASGIGVDISAAACAVARRNASALGLAERAEFRRGDWGRGLEGPFDVIVTNPPYIPTAELASLEPEVAKFEPRAALDGGTDGLVAYRALAPDLARLLAAGGHAVAEVGAGRGRAVAAVLGRDGLECTAAVRDLAGRERCVVMHRKAP